LSEKKHAGNYRGGGKMLSQAIKSTGFLILGVISLCLLIGCSAGSQGKSNLIWAKSAGGSGVDIGEGITTLSDDSTVVTGYFSGSATFGKSDTNETVLTSAGKSDIFLARYNPDGTLAWVKRAGGPEKAGGSGITSLLDDSTVVAGNFRGSCTFGPGEKNEITLTTAGLADIFIARYNPDGSLSWAKRVGGLNDEGDCKITSLSDESVVVTGTFKEPVTFGEGEINQTILTSAGGIDTFIARYNRDGTLAWAKRAGGKGWDKIMRITSMSDKSTAVTGHFEKSVTFGQGEINQTVLTSTGNGDIFIAKYNPDGTLAWAKYVGGSRSATITTLSDNSLVVAATFNGSITFGQGEPNETVLTSDNGGLISRYMPSASGYIARYNPDGTLVWAKRACRSGLVEIYGITALSDDSIVITGDMVRQTTFLTTTAISDIFVARYNPDGTLAWLKRTRGKGEFFGSAITTLSDDSSVVTGQFGYYCGGTVTFGPGEANQTVLNSAGDADIFIARFAP
jgi:uncharacterized delta-60 repeat protein